MQACKGAATTRGTRTKELSDRSRLPRRQNCRVSHPPSLSLAAAPLPPPPPRCGGRPSANIPRGFRSSICLHRPIHSSAAPSPPYMEKWVKSGAWTSSNPGHGFRPPYRLHRPLYPGGSSRRSSSASDPRILFLRFAMPLLPFLGAVNPATLAASPSLRKISRESRIFAIVVRSPVYCLLSILAPPSSLPVLPGLPLSFVRPSLPPSLLPLPPSLCIF